MSVVTLCSGGLDSAVMAAVFRDRGVEQCPLFLDYGQLAAARELESCRVLCQRLGLDQPTVMDVRGYGGVIQTGLTSASRDVFLDAFTPGRNLLFVTLAASFGYSRGSRAVGIGLLREDTCIFPDQTDAFISAASTAIRAALGDTIEILLPLRQFTKKDVVAAAAVYGVSGTYSCHKGTATPCGVCVSCREYLIE